MAGRPLSACSTSGSPRRGQRAQRPRSDGAGHRRRGGPAVGADGAAEGPRARRLRLLHQRRQRQGRADRRQSARRAAVPLEVAAPAGPCRRPGRARRPTPRPTPISPPRARDSQLGAWASDQSRPLDSRATFEQRFEEMQAAVRRRGRCPARRTGAAIASCPSGSNSGATGRTGCTSAGCSSRDGGGWSEGLLYP